MVRVDTPRAEEAASRRELRAPALAALALALLAIAGLASAASPWHATGAASAPTAALQGVAAAGGVALVVGLLLLWVETPTATRPKKKRRTPAADELDELGGSIWTAGKTVAMVLLALAVFCVATVPLLTRDVAPSQNATADPSARVAPPSRREGGRRSVDSVDLGWLLVPVAVTVAVLAPAAVLIRRRRLRLDRAAHGDEASALGRAVKASIAALETERDPRRAILRAYARMEQAFREVEIVRGRDETASELLVRTTRRLPVSASAAAALTERFEEVRYSTHQITETDREQALASLHRVERELGGRS
jgi:hypothetical protein